MLLLLKLIGAVELCDVKSLKVYGVFTIYLSSVLFVHWSMSVVEVALASVILLVNWLFLFTNERLHLQSGQMYLLQKVTVFCRMVNLVEFTFSSIPLGLQSHCNHLRHCLLLKMWKKGI